MTFLETLLKGSRYQSTEKLPQWFHTLESYSEQIRSIRNLLGMTQEQLAKRSSQHSRLIRRLESAEEIDPQLSTLKKAAEGLGCELIVRFVPKKPIPVLLKERAKKKAEQIVKISQGSSAMEEQEPNNFFVQAQINELANELLKKPSQI